MGFLHPKHFSHNKEANALIAWDKEFLSRGGRGIQNGSSKEMNGERVTVCTVRCVNPWKVLHLPVLVAEPVHSPLCPHLLPWDQRWVEVRVLGVGTYTHVQGWGDLPSESSLSLSPPNHVKFAQLFWLYCQKLFPARTPGLGGFGLVQLCKQRHLIGNGWG